MFLRNKRSSFFEARQKKSFIRLTPSVNVINLFSLLLMMRPNKLECLYLEIPFQSSLVWKHQELTQEGSIWKVLQLGWLWPCPQILRPDWKEFPRANLLAYWASSSVTKEKSFIRSTPACSVPSSLTTSARGRRRRRRTRRLPGLPRRKCFSVLPPTFQPNGRSTLAACQTRPVWKMCSKK